MESSLFQRDLTLLGLRVSKSGTVMCGKDKYGSLSDGSFVRLHGDKIPVSDVDSVSFMDDIHEIHLHMKDGRDIAIGRRELRNEAIKVVDSDGSDDGDSAFAFMNTAEMPSTLMQMDAFFDVIYPEWKDQLFYDELQESVTLDMSMLGYPDEGMQPLTDGISAEYHYETERRLRALGLTGKRAPAKEIMDEVILRKVRTNRINPFRDWVEGMAWDGVPRLRTWFQDVFGGTAPALDPQEEEVYLGDLSQAWFLGGIERMYHPFQHDIVPIFISGQGAGKTRALRYTAGNDEWYTSTSVDVTAPRGNEQFLDATRGRIVVELGEATQIRTKEVDKLKEFITKPVDQMRKAYARNSETYPRHFIIAGTSNIYNLFTDVTGNRRFFPVICDPTKQTMIFSTADRSVGAYEVRQVWAEALYKFKQGAKAIMSEVGNKLANRMQAFSSKENTSISVIENWLDDPQNGFAAKGSKITKDQIILMVFDAEPISAHYKEYEAMFNVWANGTKSWRQCKPFRIPGDATRRTHRGWERVLAPGEIYSETRFNLVSSKDDPNLQLMKAQAEMRRLNRKYRLHEMDPLPAEAKDMLQIFMDAGYVIDMGTPSNPDYRVALIP